MDGNTGDGRDDTKQDRFQKKSNGMGFPAAPSMVENRTGTEANGLLE
jgi:hypothetical protein